MKVAFITHPVSGCPLPPESVSAHIWVHEVARRLATKFPVVVYTGRSASARKSSEWCDGVHYRRISIPSHSRGASLVSKTPVLWRLQGHISFRSQWYYAGHALQIAIDMRRQACDIAHVINLSQFAPIIRAISPRTKVVLYMCSEWLTRLDRRKIESRLRHVDRVISCSDFVTEQIQRAFPGYSDHCVTVYCGVDVGRFTPEHHANRSRDGVKRVLFVGGVSPHKGLHVLLDAFSDVVKRCPEARLEIAGPAGGMLPIDWLPTLGDPEEMARLMRFYDGREYRSHLEEQIRSLGLEGRVMFSGLLPRSELAERFRKADVFVFPSLWNELFGMPIAEAMSSGIPVVATRVAGVPEVVDDGETGLLVDRGNASALAEGILRLLQDEGLRQSMGQAGRKKVLEQLSWDKIAEDLLHEYRSMIDDPHPQGVQDAAQGAA